MELGVKDNAYIIVGGTRGMGWETARRLARDGARLAIVGRTESTAAERAAELQSETGAAVIGLGADASRPGQVEQAVGRAIDELGAIRGCSPRPAPPTVTAPCWR